MDESIPAEDKKQASQKPPLSIGRIASEISAGVVAGLTVALPIS